MIRVGKDLVLITIYWQEKKKHNPKQNRRETPQQTKRKPTSKIGEKSCMSVSEAISLHFLCIVQITSIEMQVFKNTVTGQYPFAPQQSTVRCVFYRCISKYLWPTYMPLTSFIKLKKQTLLTLEWLYQTIFRNYISNLKSSTSYHNMFRLLYDLIITCLSGRDNQVLFCTERCT